MIVLKGRVIDGTGADSIEKGLVVVEGNKIKRVCKENEFPIPEGVEIVDVGKGTIMPGFIEQHNHFGCLGTVNVPLIYGLSPYEKACQGVHDLGKLLEAGFTSARETGGFANFFKAPMAKGFIKGPRLMTAGAVISQTGGHGDMWNKIPLTEYTKRLDGAYLADGVEEVRKACRVQFREGADFIKTCTTGGVTSSGDDPRHRQYSDSELLVMVEEANMHNTYVASHSVTLEGVKHAVKCGIKSLEHVFQVDDETIEMIIKNEAWVVPTFTIAQSYMDMIDRLPPYTAEKVKWLHQEHLESIRRLYEAGVKIGYGADLIGDPNINPYGEMNLREFELLAQLGMSNMELIMAATKTGSEIILRPDEVGTLEEGKLADITVCSGNPLDDIKILTKIDNIKYVMLDGKPVKNTL